MPLLLGRKDQCYDEAIQTQGFGEDEDENHTDKEFGLLSSCPDTSVTNNADCHASRQTTETHRKTRTKMGKASERRVAS